MKNLLASIAKQLVDEPEVVKVRELEGNHMSVLELSVARSDLGKVIGVKGRNINAIRTIMNAASTKIRKRIVVELVE